METLDLSFPGIWLPGKCSVRSKTEQFGTYIASPCGDMFECHRYFLYFLVLRLSLVSVLDSLGISLHFIEWTSDKWSDC